MGEETKRLFRERSPLAVDSAPSYKPRHLKGTFHHGKHSVKAVLLDRDGVINDLVYHEETGLIDSPLTLDEFQILPHVPQAVRLLNDLGLRTAVVSNQPGIAKGHLKHQTLMDQNKAMLDALQQVGARIEGIYYCLHHPQALVPELRQVCECRKPGTGLLQQASRDLGVASTSVT